MDIMPYMLQVYVCAKKKGGGGGGKGGGAFVAEQRSITESYSAFMT